MARVPLIFPYGGRFDSAAHSQQPELYTRSARNVRVRDPRTGKLRGAQRSGSSKWNPDVIGASRIKALCSTAIDDRKIEYAFDDGDTSLVWDTPTPSKSNCLDGKTDSAGNVYALDGQSAIVKYNSAGREIMKIALPVADPLHVCRALFVDDAGRIFAGVSSGGDVKTARVFCILQLQDNEFFVLWTLEPAAYTEELRVYRGTQLYAAHNYPDENRGRVLIYENIGLDPVETNRIEHSVPYPINSMDVGADGSVYCASPDSRGDAVDNSLNQADFRPGHASQRYFHPHVQGWTPWQLTDARKRIWSWYDAEDIDTTDLEQSGSTPTLDEGQQILRWRDRTANNRHWYAGSLEVAGEEGPKYQRVGPGGLPAVRFVNTPAAQGGQKSSLVTLPNPSIAKNLADQQRTAIPAYTDAMWAMFLLIRPTRDAESSGAPVPRCVFFADNQAAAPATDHSLWVNRACGAAVPGTYLATAISYATATDSVDVGGCATGDQFAGRTYVNFSRQTDCALVTVLWDGGVDPNDTTKTRCLFRVNGEPVDRCEGLAFSSLIATWLGMRPADAAISERRFVGEICEMLVLDRSDRFALTEPKVATHDQLKTGDPATDQTDNEIAQIESYMMHRRGIGHLLGGGGLPSYPHFYGEDVDGVSSPPSPSGSGRSTPLSQVIQRYPLTTKHNTKGELLWLVNENTHPDTGANRGGIGYGVRARTIESDGKTHVWLTGPDAVQATTGDVALRKIIDNGSSFSGAFADGAWRHKFSGNATIDYAYPRMAADKFGVLYYPGYHTGGGTMRPLHVFQKDPDGSGNAQQLLEFLLAGSASLAHAVALPPDALIPDYRGDLTVELSENVYLFTVAASAANPDSVHKVNLVTSSALATGTARSVHTIAVTEDDIRLISASSNTIPSGGSGVIDSAQQFIQAFRAGDDIVVIDGINVWAYAIRDGTVAKLESTSAGEVPQRPKLGMYWRHRLVLGNLADAAGQYGASRLGNIRDWNLRPGALPTGEQIQTATQAFVGSATRAGEVEDAITALIPVWDDLAFIGCESRILRLTGDPQDGGNIHKVTDSMGITFGEAWCKDQSGRVFVFGNAPPGLYGLPAVGDPVPLSRHTLEESEMAEIDFSTHRIVLAWNPIERGVHIWQVAWGTSTVVDHWFWEEKTHRFVKNPPIWPDRYATVALQPTAYTYLGGDDTRALLIGCEDGYVRMLDPEAESDDGELIDSLVVIGPITPKGGPEVDHRIISVEIALADDQGGARLELFGGETADSLGPILWARDLRPGLNNFRVRLKAAKIWARLRGIGLKRWAWEEGKVTMFPTSKTQQGSEIG